MITRSVPLYADVQTAIPRLARHLPDSPLVVVDLGCSTGTSLWHISRAFPERSLELIGTDNSPAMLEKCQEKLAGIPDRHRLQLIEADLRDTCPGPASLILMNYTLQFVAVEERPAVLRQVYDALRPGGLFVFSEKFAHPDADRERDWFELYIDYKRRHGYSELEIARKRDALENVLIPLSVDGNRDLLEEAGFDRPELMLKWFNFGTFLCRR